MFSIIVCTYNRDKYIYQALSCLAKNDFLPENYEIVLINNNSTDNTEQECQRFYADYPAVNFRYFIEQEQGLSHARNRGIKEATNEVLIFLDDDAFVSEHYLKNLAKHINEHPEIMAFGGKITPLFESGEAPAWLSKWSYSFVSAVDRGNNISEFTGKSFPVGANMGFYKKCIESTSGFNTLLGRKKKSLGAGEEKDLFYRFRKKGLQVFYLPDIEIQHIIPESRTTYDYIKKLGNGVGVSEHRRCKQDGFSTLLSRYFSEFIKWGATLVLWCFYAFQLKLPKGNILVLFRWNVTKGLFS